ncbi:MAG: hypothetical protein ACE5JV_01935, partial [Nitrososphaerales archaeon]
SQTSRIASDLMKIIPDKVPFLRQVASGSLEGVIKKNVAFSPSEPEEISGNLYRVTDNITVKVGSNIPLIGKRFTISINYRIEVDVKQKRVVEAAPDLTSLRVDLL